MRRSRGHRLASGATWKRRNPTRVARNLDGAGVDYPGTGWTRGVTIERVGIVPGADSKIHDEPHVEGRRITVREIHARVEGRGLRPETVADRHGPDVADVHAALACRSSAWKSLRRPSVVRTTRSRGRRSRHRRPSDRRDGREERRRGRRHPPHRTSRSARVRPPRRPVLGTACVVGTGQDGGDPDLGRSVAGERLDRSRHRTTNHARQDVSGVGFASLCRCVDRQRPWIALTEERVGAFRHPDEAHHQQVVTRVPVTLERPAERRDRGSTCRAHETDPLDPAVTGTAVSVDPRSIPPVVAR